MRRNVVRLGSTAEIRVVVPVWEDPAGEVAKGKIGLQGRRQLSRGGHSCGMSDREEDESLNN